MTARGVPPETYPVRGMCCVRGEGEVGYPDLRHDWGSPSLRKNLGPETGAPPPPPKKGPGTRGREGNWNQRLGYPLPPTPVEDMKTLPSRRTSYAGGKNTPLDRIFEKYTGNPPKNIIS